MLSDVVSDHAQEVRAFAAKCLEVIPQGGLVYVNHCGHTVRWAHPAPLESTFVGTMPVTWLVAR